MPRLLCVDTALFKECGHFVKESNFGLVRTTWSIQEFEDSAEPLKSEIVEVEARSPEVATAYKNVLDDSKTMLAQVSADVCTYVACVRVHALMCVHACVAVVLQLVALELELTADEGTVVPEPSALHCKLNALSSQIQEAHREAYGAVARSGVLDEDGDGMVDEAEAAGLIARLAGVCFHATHASLHRYIRASHISMHSRLLTCDHAHARAHT